MKVRLFDLDKYSEMTMARTILELPEKAFMAEVIAGYRRILADRNSKLGGK